MLKKKIQFPQPSSQPNSRKIGSIKAPFSRGHDGFVLTIGDEGAVLALIKGGNTERRLFAAKPEAADTSTMSDVLKQSRSLPIYVVLDVMDQHYVRQSFPPVSAMNLNKIVQRRLDRDLPEEDLKGAIRLGRDTEGRKEWLYLLASITLSPELQSWLDWVLVQENSFQGIFLLPIEATGFVPKIKAACASDSKASWQILFMHTKVGGFRQVVLQNGRLMFTRISQVAENSSPDFLAGSVEQEIQNTLDYLRRFELESNQDVEAYIIIGADIKTHIDLKRFAFSHSELLTPHEASELLELENAALFADNYTDIVFSHLFLQSKPIKRFLPKAAERIMAMENAIRGIKIAAASVSAICILLSLFSLLQYFTNLSEISGLERKKKALEMQHEKLEKVVSAQGEDEKIAMTISMLRSEKNLGKFQPQDFVKQLAPLLAPDVVVTSFEWQKLNIPATGVYIEGPTDVAVTVTMEFTGNYSDDVAFAAAANAQNDAIVKAFNRYKIETIGLPGATGEAKLEIDFGAGRLRDNSGKKRTLQLKFRGLLPEVVGSVRTYMQGRLA